MNIFIIGIMSFIGSVIIIELLIYAVSNLRTTREARIKKRLRKYVFENSEDPNVIILKQHVASQIPLLNQFIMAVPFLRKLNDLVIQSDTRYHLGFFLLLSALLGSTGHLMGRLYIPPNISPIFREIGPFLTGICLLPLPFFFLTIKKKKRIKKFKSQFHEGLDFVARALKTGQAFSGAIRLTANEFPAPLGTEFHKIVDEINFGVSVPDALKHMAERMDCPELRYFIVAVIVQRETGGNLSELMETLARLIRRRFEFEGKVRTLSAEGKLSAVILICMPFVVTSVLMFLNPEFLDPLFQEPLGIMMIIGACISMLFGAVIVSRITKINV